MTTSVKCSFQDFVRSFAFLQRMSAAAGTGHLSSQVPSDCPESDNYLSELVASLVGASSSSRTPRPTQIKPKRAFNTDRKLRQRPCLTGQTC